MMTNVTARSVQWSMARSTVSRTAELLLVGLIGWLWFVAVRDPAWRAVAWKAVPLVVVLPLAGRIAIRQFRARRRLRAAWDSYAEQELAKRTNSRRNFHARPQSQGR